MESYIDKETEDLVSFRIRNTRNSDMIRMKVKLQNTFNIIIYRLFSGHALYPYIWQVMHKSNIFVKWVGQIPQDFNNISKLVYI